MMSILREVESVLFDRSLHSAMSRSLAAEGVDIVQVRNRVRQIESSS